MSADKLAQAVQTWINNWDAEGFGCACAPGVTCGTCQWRNRIRPLQEALAAHQAQQAEPEQKPCLVSGACKHGSWCSETYCQEHCKFVKEAPQPSHVPGWQLVPVEPTPEVLEALFRNERDPRAAWAEALRAAAPQQGDKTP